MPTATADPGGRPFPRRRGQGAGTAAQLFFLCFGQQREAFFSFLFYLSRLRFGFFFRPLALFFSGPAPLRHTTRLGLRVRRVPRALGARGRGSAGADPPPRPARKSTGRARGDSDPTRRARPGQHRGPEAGAARSAAGGGTTKERRARCARGTGSFPPSVLPRPRHRFSSALSLSLALEGGGGFGFVFSRLKLEPHRRPVLLAAGTHGTLNSDQGQRRHLAWF